MSKGLFITATGTDVGKTYVSALIVKKLRQAGYSAGYYKAALSGAERHGKMLVPGDAAYVKRISGLDEPPEQLVSYVYEHAVSPHLAARIEGIPVDLGRVKSDYRQAASRYDYVTMEGSGGIVCPIRFDAECKLFLEDLIRQLGLGTLIVADAGLGTINTTVLTVEYLKARQIPVKGIILNRFRRGNLMEEDNRKMIEAITKFPVCAVVSEGDENLRMDAGQLASLYS